MTWKKKGIRHDTKHDRIRLSEGKKHKDGWDFILCEYDTPPEVELQNIQQVRAVWCSHKHRWELHVVCDEEIAAESPGEKVVGVDPGICNPAAVVFPDDAVLYPGNTLREDKHYFQREEYQTEGDHGPSRTAKWAREKLSKRKDDFLHALSNGVSNMTPERSWSAIPVVLTKMTGAGTGTSDWTTGGTSG